MFFLAKKEQNYASSVLKFGTKKNIFTIILTIYVGRQIRFSKSDEN